MSVLPVSAPPRSGHSPSSHDNRHYLEARFPDLTFSGPGISINNRLIGLKPDLNEAIQRARYINGVRRAEQALKAAYPHLSFRVWNLPWYTNQDQLLGEANTPTTVNVVREKKAWRQEMATDFTFSWPLTDETKDRLWALDRDASLVDADHFFCTKCRTTYHNDYFADYLLTEFRCIHCADEIFLENAYMDRKIHGTE